MKHVLITGAAGRIGASLRRTLDGKYRFRSLDIVPVLGATDAILADVRDLDTLVAAMAGVDAVVHLAGVPSFDQAWEDVHSTGMGGTYNVLEAARRAGVRRVIYASSGAVLGSEELKQRQSVSPGMPVHPRTLYGIGKATGELLCRYYAEKHGLSVICLRIGAFHTEPPMPEGAGEEFLQAWCSPADLAQLVEKCIEAEGITFEIFYAVSNNRRRLYDISNAQRRVGYRPQQDAERVMRPRPVGQPNPLAELHRLLMRAAVLPGAAALESWRQWQEQVHLELDPLDAITHRMLPLIYHNLSTQQTEDRWMSKLKGVYRRAWLENQLRLQRAVQLVEQIQERGFPVLALDDLASILSLYDGQGARRLDMLDLLVQYQDIPALIRQFREWNIASKPPYPERYLAVETPLEFWPPFEIRLTVAWRALPAIQDEPGAQETWNRALPATRGELQVLVPDLETHFLRACWRAASVGLHERPFVLIDMAWMLIKRGDELDLPRLVELARANQLILLAERILRELTSIAASPKGEQLLQMLLQERVTMWERLEGRVLYGYAYAPGLAFRVVRRLLLYRRSVKQKGWLGPLRYVEYVWGVRGLRSLPGRALNFLRRSWRLPGRA